MKLRGIFVLVLAVFLLSFVSASYNLTNYSIQSQYATGSSISGNLKISFTNEPITNEFTDSLGNKVPLKSLLESSKDYDYKCSYPQCESKFKETDLSSNFDFNLNKGENAFYGFIFKGSLVGIDSVKFNLRSDVGESPTNQLSLDFLNDKSVDLVNPKKGNAMGDVNHGCYNPSNETEFDLDSTYTCQKISLNDAPDVQIGGWVKEITSSTNSSAKMNLLDSSGILVGGCSLHVSGEEETFCDANVSVTKGDYYVCIKKTGIGDGEYKIRGHYQDNNCGFKGFPPQSPIYSYQLGAKENYYGSYGTILINNTLPDGESLPSMIENYISSNYGSLDCSSQPKGCIVPIKFSSSSNQNLTLSNLDIKYDLKAGSGVHLTKFSQLNEDPSLVNSSVQTLLLGNFFSLPNQEKNLTYSLSYDGKTLFDNKKISLKNFNIEIYPKNIPVSFLSEIAAYVPPELNPFLYEWDFGDNNSQITQTELVQHAYPSEGNYTLTLTVSTDIGEITKSFKVTVGSAKNVLKSELENRKDDLDRIDSTLSSLTSFEKKLINSVVDIPKLRGNLTALQNEEASASTELDYNKIIQEFLNLNFPKLVQNAQVSNSFLNPSQSQVDVNVLNSATGKNYTLSDSTTNYIKFWNVNHLSSNLGQRKLSVFWDDGTSYSFNVYKLSILPSKSINESYYLFIKDSGNLTLNENSSFKSSQGYEYTKLNGKNQDFTFSTSGDYEIGNNVFISPSNVIENSLPNPQPPISKTWIIYVSVFGVLVLGFIIYLFMLHWYNSKYEKFLFPDKNQLYNAIFYITNLSKRGIQEEEIRQNLVKAGWKREQVTYLLRKYAGKRTGMPNLFGFIKLKKNVNPNITTPPHPGGNLRFKSVDDTKFNK